MVHIKNIFKKNKRVILARYFYLRFCRRMFLTSGAIHVNGNIDEKILQQIQQSAEDSINEAKEEFKNGFNFKDLIGGK